MIIVSNLNPMFLVETSKKNSIFSKLPFNETKGRNFRKGGGSGGKPSPFKDSKKGPFYNLSLRQISFAKYSLMV